MKKHPLLKITFMVIMLALFAIPLAGQHVLAKAPLPVSGVAAVPTLQLPETFFSESTAQKLWVVRVYFTDRQQLAQLASRNEPWEVNEKEGYLVYDVTTDERDRLIAQGYRVEVDQAQTERLNRPLEYLPGQTDAIPGYPCYRTVEETFTTATDIVAAYPDLAEWIDIGNSWEKTQLGGLPGYDLMVLRLTNETIGGVKPKLFIMSSLHAREYTPAELSTRFAEYLIQNYGIDADATWLLDYTEIHLLLQANPDGRKKAETGLSWRKNTNENYCSPTSNNRGADLNRNFAFEWGCCGGSSGAPCDLTYRGPSPASEPEVQAVQDYVRLIFPDQRGSLLTDPAPSDATGIFMDMHSYSQLVLWSWGFTDTVPPNGTQLQTLGRKFAYFNGYEPEQAVGLYPTDGTTDDFVYGDLGVASYTFEMGTDFFQDCSTFENTIVPENLPALVYAAKASRTPYQTPAGPDALAITALPNMVPEGTLVTLQATINDTRYNNQNGIESTQNIAAAAYYIDTPPWQTGAITNTLSAADGNFNATIEDVTATIDTTGLSSGRHTIFVRGQDTNGQWGAVSAVFFYVIDPATAPRIQGYVQQDVTNLPLDATVSASGIFQTQTDPATGFYQMYVISGTYTLEASAENHASQSFNDVAVEEGQTVVQNFHLAPTCTAFSDDVEAGNIGWTGQSPWAITTENSHSATHSWTDSPGGNYGNNRNTALTSPTIDLTGFSNIRLDFWQICDTEAGYDYCRVEVSNNNGATWTSIGTFDGPHTQWENVVLPASMLDNQPDARIRFRFTSDTNLVDDGWHVDDIHLDGVAASCIVYTPPTAAFSSTSPNLLGTPTHFTNLSSGSDLGFEWNFGDTSPIVTDTSPTHTYTETGFYTVTLTATNLSGSDVFSDVVEIFSYGVADFAIHKTVNADEAEPGDILTYTLRAGLTLTDTHSFYWELVDTLPAAVHVLTESIQVNGAPASALYLPEKNSIFYQANGYFTATHAVTITFQVQVDSDVVSGTLVTNQFYGSAFVDGLSLTPPPTVNVSTRIFVPFIPPTKYDLFLPLLAK